MKTVIPIGTADATGEKTGFQAKNGLFPSGVLFFLERWLGVFHSGNE
jgi:hypothetical protein